LDYLETKEAAKTWHGPFIHYRSDRMEPGYCGHPQLYQTWVQYIHVIAWPSTLPAARSSVSSGTSTLRILSSLSTQSSTSLFMEAFP
jgi:hypothetical protein